MTDPTTLSAAECIELLGWTPRIPVDNAATTALQEQIVLQQLRTAVANRIALGRLERAA